MFDLFNAANNKTEKNLLLLVGSATAVLIMVHYYHQIKLARLQITEAQRDLSN